jgi:hypothetical protein
MNFSRVIVASTARRAIVTETDTEQIARTRDILEFTVNKVNNIENGAIQPPSAPNK